MKKGIRSYYLLYCFLCGLILLGPGCDKLDGHRPEKVYGTVISVDAAKKEVIIKDVATGKQRTITAQSADQLAALKPGMEIKARVKRGTTVAERIEVRAEKQAKKAGAKKSGDE